MFESSYTQISGTFVRICPEDQIEIALEKGSPNRAPGRYNRKGEDALYLTPTEESARTALIKYKDSITEPLVLVKYDVQPTQVVDLRSDELSDLRRKSSVNWQESIKRGEEPSSWSVADQLKKNNEIGLIDPSRKNPDIWHLTLFRWNEAGAPTVNIIGSPTPIKLR